MTVEAWIHDINRQKGDETGVKIKMRENRVATVETSNLSELTAIKSQMDTLSKQFSTLMQHVNTQAVVNQAYPVIPPMHPSSRNVTNSPVKPMQWQQNSKP